MLVFASSNSESALVVVNECQQVANRPVRLNGVPERVIGLNEVVILAADLFALEDPAGFEIGDDPLDGSFRNSDLQRHFAKHHRRVARQQHQDVRVVRQESPLQRVRIFRRGNRWRCDGNLRL